MIIQEHFDINGRDFIRTYSDANRYVVRDGIEYSEACDPAEFGRTYTEGNIIEDEASGYHPSDSASEIVNILLGGEQV